MADVPREFWKVLQASPQGKHCQTCGAPLVWNPYLRQWEDEGLFTSRHYCPDEAIQALIPDVHGCLHCGHIVLVYADGRRLGQDLLPHQCNRKPARPKQIRRKQPATKQRAHRGAVDI